MSKRSRTRNSYPLWDVGVAKTPWNVLDPMIEYFPMITQSTRIVGLGCCFVQRMAAFLAANGYNFYSVDQKYKVEEGIFSAGFGNVNSPRQAVQVIKGAYHELLFPDSDSIWKQKDGDQFIDALCPAFSTPGKTVEDVKTDRENRFTGIREAIEKAEVLIYTHGLNECWSSKSTGIVYPITPGTLNRDFDADDMELLCFTVSDILKDCEEFFQCLRKHNPTVKVILAVSPISMIATFVPDRHVLFSNCYGKSVLRAAFQELADKYDFIHYFPIYEIFTGLHTTARFYKRNLREPTEAGINFAMKFFLRHFTVETEEDAVKTKFVSPDYSMIRCDPHEFITDNI